MDYTVSNSLLSSKVLERIILFYILSSYYIDKYYIYILNLSKRVIVYIYKPIVDIYRDNGSVERRYPNDFLERDSLSKYRCSCRALRGRVAGLFKGKGFSIRRALRKWLREGIRESSVSRTEKE